MSKNFMIVLLLSIIYSYNFIHADELPFGYISYSTFNIGDDIQSLAAKRFLPKNAIPIDREYIGVFQHPTPVKTIVNGWYMHTKHNLYYFSTKPAPQKIWPPSPCIDPLLISIHFTKDFFPFAFSQESIMYLRQHGPVGTRDYATLSQLKKLQIPCYFSGCLTLTLENNFTTRKNVIYAVDVDDETVRFIQSKTSTPVQIIRHIINRDVASNNERRMKLAQETLDLYRQAKCVVTSRLHAALPCLAFQTPVLFLPPEMIDPRFTGLLKLVRHCSREELLKGSYDFNFESPPENPEFYLPIRNKLIETVTKWVRQ